MSDLMKFLVVGNQSFEVCDAAARAGIGSPLKAAEVADMTDTDKVYVYVGDETGYENGHWYYYDGSDWQDGGIYNSAAIQLDTTLSIAGEAADAKAVGDALVEKANIDGEYESMTVGNAEQLVATVGENNKTPYNFRTSGGSIDIGDREVDKLVGGTVAWNQNVNRINLNDSYGYTFSTGDNGYLKIDGTSTSANNKLFYEDDIAHKDHKFLVMSENELPNGFSLSQSYNANIRKAGIIKGTQSGGTRLLFYFSFNAGATADNFETHLNVMNLTQKFGSTIADYIYTLEQSTAGAGVTWFKKLFPNDYYAYNAGQLMSVKTSSHDMVGFNAYNNTTGKAKLVGGMEYQITGTYTAISYSTGETLTPDADGKFTPTADGELTVTGGNGSDTCVHLVWDGERDGEFEEYKKYSYALDPDLELRGIPKLDANNQLYYDGDTYESDGTVTRRCGIVDLGTLEYSFISSINIFYASISNLKIPDTTADRKTGILSTIPVSSVTTINASMDDKSMLRADNNGSGAIFIRDTSYTSVETFKTAMSGIYLDYELATPTIETADPYQNPQIVDDWGTEEYVDSRTVAIPVGHDTMYQANLRAKLEMMPNLPEVNGDYLLRQSASGAEYVAHTSPIPTLPSEDGTYVLKCTVASGTATLTWEAQT